MRYIKLAVMGLGVTAWALVAPIVMTAHASSTTHAPCKVTATWTVAHRGATPLVEVSGKCFGHPPTAQQMFRLSWRDFGIRWLHISKPGYDEDACHSLAVIVYGGNGDTTALVCKDGKAFTS